MLKRSLERTELDLEKLLQSVGDMALRRRAKKILCGLALKDTDRMLEIGCGNGYYLSLLNRLDFKLNLIGIDNDKVALKNAKIYIKNKSVKLLYSDAESLPFPENNFDKIIMSEVIEHVENEERVLKEAYRVLKPGGIFVLTTCNINYPFLWDPINWTLQHFFNTHIQKGFWAGIWNQHTRLYKKEQIEKATKKAGFKIEKVEFLTGWCLPFNHYIVNFIAKLFYSGKLPRNLSKGINKFQNNKQSILVKFIFYLINLWDKLNDFVPQKSSVSIFIKARKIK